MNNKFLSSFYCAAISILFSCNSKEPQRFYEEYSGFDIKIAPIVEPYFIASTLGFDGAWYLDDGHGGTEVSAVGLSDTLIVNYYYNKAITNLNNRDTTWHIVMPKSRNKLTFNQRNDFYNKVQDICDSEPFFISPKEIFSSFHKQNEKGNISDLLHSKSQRSDS